MKENSENNNDMFDELFISKEVSHPGFLIPPKSKAEYLADLDSDCSIKIGKSDLLSISKD